MTRLALALSIGLTLCAQDFPPVRTYLVASGFQNITDIAALPDGSGRLIVLEQRGRIRMIANGARVESPFLDISDRVHGGGGERGLLGIAFPPGFAAKRYFYVNYTERQAGATIVSRFRMAGDTADPTSEQVILTIAQPFSNHNGGQIRFGPDGFLYIGMGDGGSAGDPQNNGQRTDTLLGKLLRIDPESGSAPYAVPSSNPFVNRSDARPEIWAFGLRNPWRFSFDRETNDLWIADVGQNTAEEVNFTPASSRGGENYGWRIMEALRCFNPPGGCNQTGLILPVFEYTRDLGVSVTGGYVYRGNRYPALRGLYFFGDFGSGRLWATRREGGQFVTRQVASTGFSISTFGEDEAGELYVADYGGRVFLMAGGGPSFTAESVVNAASFGPGLVPGSLATIFGRGLTVFNGIVQAPSFPLPKRLNDVSVALNGIEAPVLALANVNGLEQINIQVPFELTGVTRAILVVTAAGERSAEVAVEISTAQPEIFVVTRSENSAVLWATGVGAVSNAPATGQAAPDSPLARTVAEPEVTIGGVPARVLYSGLAPRWAGLYQVNVELPLGVASGAEVILRLGNVVSRAKTLP